MSNSRRVLITGGTNGIGLAAAKRFAESGDSVTVWGRNIEKIDEINRDDSGIVAEKVDVSSPQEVRSAAERLVKNGTVDVLVNAAGFTKPVTTKMSFDEAKNTWDELIATNLTGSFLVILALANHITRPGGRIINIGSIAAFTGSVRPGGIGYAAAKAGVNGMTLALARELGPEGITVNVIAPGFIGDTGLTKHYEPDVINKIVGLTPVGRAGSVEDIASAVLYLASPEASFVNGEIHHVNGGWLPGR